MRGMGRHAVVTGDLYDIDEQIAAVEALTCGDVAEEAEGFSISTVWRRAASRPTCVTCVE